MIAALSSVEGATITITTPGRYCYGAALSTAGSQQFGVVKNGPTTTGIHLIMSGGSAANVLTNAYMTASIPPVPASRCSWLEAGDVLRAQDQGTGAVDNNYATKFWATKVGY